ncbi:MAG: S1 RNA-binding domain-containing protein, partial [Candidatus Bathyarchaeia archaeon]
IGPVEALLHISQVMDDYITYDERQGTLTGKETRRKLMRGDKVRVRVTAVSMSKGGASSKIGVTMRQPFLGKLEWIKEDVRRLEAGAKSAKRAEVATP